MKFIARRLGQPVDFGGRPCGNRRCRGSRRFAVLTRLMGWIDMVLDDGRFGWRSRPRTKGERGAGGEDGAGGWTVGSTRNATGRVVGAVDGLGDGLDTFLAGLVIEVFDAPFYTPVSESNSAVLWMERVRNVVIPGTKSCSSSFANFMTSTEGRANSTAARKGQTRALASI